MAREEAVVAAEGVVEVLVSRELGLLRRNL